MKVKGNVFKKAREKTLSNHFETTCERTKRARKESLLLREECTAREFSSVFGVLLLLHCLDHYGFAFGKLMRSDQLSRVVDCILALKAYHGWKQINGGTGVSKCTKSPLLSNSRRKNFSRPLKVSFANAHRHLNMLIADESLSLEDVENRSMFRDDEEDHEMREDVDGSDD
ncbi:hypothetical protein Dimus_009285 [Dionaea muscipula]